MDQGKIIAALSTRVKQLGKVRLISIDNWIFSLHYRVTFIILLVFCLLISATQFFGDPIHCVKTEKFLIERVINTYCWVEGTFTIPRALSGQQGKDVPTKGIDTHVPGSGEETITHVYYQWVCWVLLLQSFAFYMTRILWKNWEGGRLNGLILELNNCILSGDKRESKIKCLIDNLTRRHGLWNWYSIRYLICEVLNVIHVLVQIIITDRFVNGEFSTYGIEVLKFMNQFDGDRVDPMIRVFPKMTKCRFSVFGSSGDVQVYDNFCLLPLNIFNEKVYLFLWFWFLALFILSVSAVVYRLACIVSYRARFLVMRFFNHTCDGNDIDYISRTLNHGDWFILYLLAKNLDAMNFRSLSQLYASELKTKASEKQDNQDSILKSV